jgi:cell division protein ZapD
MKVFSQRINILGGTCNFDLPRLHYWLKQSEFERRQDLIDWSSDLIPIKESGYILLENIRKSSTPTHEDAESGFYHKQIEANMSCQLIRVNISSISPYYPDISGVKHRFTIRFMEGVDSNTRPTQTHNDVHFELYCCIL